MNRELISVIDELGRQKGIDKSRVIGAIEAALQMAAKKRFGQAENIQVEIDSKTGEISVVSKKTIVDAVANPKTEVSLQEARQFDSEAEVGDEIGSVIEMSDLGRIAAQTAKQVIFQKVREAEWEAVQKEYSTRQGDLVNGIILGVERRNYLVDLGKTEAVLPIQEQIPRETYRTGDRVKAMLLEVRRTPKDVQVILTRSHPQFVSKLFELEVPEVLEKIVESPRRDQGRHRRRRPDGQPARPAVRAPPRGAGRPDRPRPGSAWTRASAGCTPRSTSCWQGSHQRRHGQPAQGTGHRLDRARTRSPTPTSCSRPCSRR